MNLRIKRDIFNPVYLPYVNDYSRREEIYYGGAGSGKSVFVAQKLVIKALQMKRRVLIIRKFGSTLRDSVFSLICATLSQFQIYGYCKVTQTNFTITLPNGSVFIFKGIDDPEKIKSITDITDIWIEEATEISEEEFDQLDLRLRAAAPFLQIFLSFNPVSKASWCYRRWFSGAPVGDETLILKTTYKDNIFLPESYITALESKINTNPTYYKIYALGEFCSLDRLVFENWDRIQLDDIPKGTLIVGLDFGFVNDPAALIAGIVSGNDLYIFREWGATGKTNPELAEVIKALGFQKAQIIADSAEEKSIKEIQRAGIQHIRPSVKGPDSVINGIKKLWEYNIHVSEECTGLITELENYSWQRDRRTGEYIEKPVDAFNHYIDAMRYALQVVTRSARPVFMSKAGFGL